MAGLETKLLTFNPLTNDFQLLTENAVSFEIVPLNKTVIVRPNQQMALNTRITIDGTLILEGTLAIWE